MKPYISYTDTLTDDIKLNAAAFFEGWPRRPDDTQFAAVLKGSHAIVLAVHDGEVIGFINAISDGVLTAFIPWLEVQPQWRGQGIGAELVGRIIQALDGMYSIDLTCDPHLIPYYERLDLVPLAGMCKRNPSALTMA